jgi:integrase
MPRLFKRVIDQITPQQGDYFVWDTTLPGFGVRVFPSGRKTYLVQYRDAHGRTRRYTLGPHGVLTPDQARQLAQDALARVRAGANPAQVRKDSRHAPTVAALAERFQLEQLPLLKSSSARNYQQMLTRHILPALGTQAVPAVTRDDLAALHRRLRTTPYMANRVLSLCAVLLNWAEEWGMRPEGSNPARRVTPYKERPRERYLTPGELARLGTALAEAGRTERREALALVRLLLFTGARLGELLTLRWEWGRLRLPESKTGAKTLYLGPPALAILEGLGPQRQGLVLPGVQREKPMAHPHKVWRRLCAAAHLEGVRLHDLRHTFGQHGGDPGGVPARCGHVTRPRGHGLHPTLYASGAPCGPGGGAAPRGGAPGGAGGVGREFPYSINRRRGGKAERRESFFPTAAG